MYLGYKSPQVNILQKDLNILGYPTIIDGDFGLKTERSVILFQLENGLVVDGQAGRDTLLVMANRIKEFKAGLYYRSKWINGEFNNYHGGVHWQVDNGIRTSSGFERWEDTTSSTLTNILKLYTKLLEDKDLRLVATIISVESTGNPNAMRPEPAINDKSYGLMQILYTTAKGVGFSGVPEDLLDPAINVELGWKYIQSLEKYHGWDPVLVAACYNAGRIKPSSSNRFHTHTYGTYLDKFIKYYNSVI